MKILNPSLLLFLLLLIPFTAVAFMFHRKRFQSYLKLGGSGDKRGLFRLRSLALFVSFALFFIFSVLALSDITLGRQAVRQDNFGLEVVFVLDVSMSMLATDAAPSRMEQARALATELSYGLNGSRQALVVFKGIALPLSPLTDDNTALGGLIRASNPNLLTAQGSNLSAGIRLALGLFSNDDSNKQVIILISDGEALSGDIGQAIRETNRRNITIFSIGVGSEEGANLYDSGGEPLVDKNGNKVHSRLEESALINAANLTGGSYFKYNENLSGILNQLKQYEQASYRIDYRDRELFTLFVLLVFISLLSGEIIRSARWQDLYGSY
jgi:Ca-activated chloride channel family protein